MNSNLVLDSIKHNPFEISKNRLVYDVGLKVMRLIYFLV